MGHFTFTIPHLYLYLRREYKLTHLWEEVVGYSMGGPSLYNGHGGTKLYCSTFRMRRKTDAPLQQDRRQFVGAIMFDRSRNWFVGTSAPTSQRVKRLSTDRRDVALLERRATASGSTSCLKCGATGTHIAILTWLGTAQLITGNDNHSYSRRRKRERKYVENGKNRPTDVVGESNGVTVTEK